MCLFGHPISRAEKSSLYIICIISVIPVPGSRVHKIVKPRESLNDLMTKKHLQMLEIVTGYPVEKKGDFLGIIALPPTEVGLIAQLILHQVKLDNLSHLY